MEKILSRIERGESMSNLETRRVRKGGRMIDASVTISPITDDAGKVIGASTIARELHHRNAEEPRCGNGNLERQFPRNNRRRSLPPITAVLTGRSPDALPYPAAGSAISTKRRDSRTLFQVIPGRHADQPEIEQDRKRPREPEVDTLQPF